MNNNNELLKNVAMFAWSEARYVFIALAKKMKTENNAQVHLYCSSDEQVKFYRQQNADGIFASIENSEMLLSSAAKEPPREQDVIDKARLNEKNLGVTYNMLAVSNRHFGRGYALGGFRHPRSRHSERTSYIQMLNAYNITLDFWQKQIEEKKLSLVIQGPKWLAVMCRTRKIPFRFLCVSRYKNLHNWAWNEFLENPEFTFAYKKGIGEGDGVLNAPYGAYTSYRKVYIQRAKFTSMVKNIAMKIAYHTWWTYKGYKKAKSYYLSEEIKYFYNVWQDWKHLDGLGHALKDVEDKRFVYYPLHTEPETALQGVSPEFFYQLSLIAAISRDLPAGVFLIVKEHHQAVGRRPRDFYDQIVEFKNVLMLDTFEIGYDCIQKADAVVTICGTSGLEAAAAGKPVIAFGQHNIYNVLPNVHAITDEADLRPCLEKIFNGDHDEKGMAADAQKFLQAVTACSFDMDQYDYQKLDDFSLRSIEAAYDHLVQGLKVQSEIPSGEPFCL